MSGQLSPARVRRLAAQHGLQLRREPDGRYALIREDPAWPEARGELQFLLQVLEPPERSRRPRWASRP